ncbi:dna replication regulator sld2 [Trichoderma cornu-damae]|uniref:DNA replication regulator SLD2 n=1 Tax=Trichoderma cornu-damae TaxID=654480 RepID=A0A9P8QIK9_9HYPO|nr:dna replication regulator sld2 [Trichoderma cornu-damae]
MDEKLKREYEARAQKVRTDLKQWEAGWAKTHDGKKPGREDIKNNPVIAQKYKDYNKLRDIIAGKLVPPSDASASKQKHDKRKSDGVPAETPMKRAKHAETPSKRLAPPNGDGYMNSPAVSRKLFSPAPVTSVGPTPQRDGKVLGLFDLLVEREFKSPLKGIKETGRPGSSHATPSKRRGSLGEDVIAKLGRTPGSASKRKLFSTPRKKRDGQDMAGTPTSVSKLQFDTPAFLKRHSLPTLDENTTFDAPPLRLPRKPLVRGLSEIVASLRKVEEEQLDDDLEALREAEAEMESGAPVQPATRPQKLEPTADILEPDSQAKQLPLGGFDDEGTYDSPAEEAVDRDGRPVKIFKKKGQKRTTRRVNIRPVRTKRPTNPAEGNESDEGEGDQDTVPDTVPDTQAHTGKSDVAGESDGEYEDGDDARDTKAKTPAKQEGVVKKAARKVNQLAHANFHRLKLRNHGAKGGPGHNSRFRRRR